MERNVSSICVTVVVDSGRREDTPRKVTLAATDILSVDDAVPNQGSTTPEGGARIVLVEEVQTRTPWVFSDEDDDAPPPHRELMVTESPRVVDLILGWARAQPRTYSADDVKEQDDWFAAGMPLKEDLVLLPPIKFVRRAGTVPSDVNNSSKPAMDRPQIVSPKRRRCLSAQSSATGET